MQLHKLARSYISLHWVTCSCMQAHELACMQFPKLSWSSMSLHPVPFLVWAAHKNFAVLVLYKASASRFKECKYTVYMIQVFAWKVHFHCPKIRSIKSPCSLLFLSLQSKTISRWSNPVWAWILLKLYLSDQITISSDWPNSFPPAYYRPLVSSKSASFTCKTFCETDNQNYHPYSVFYQT